MDLPDRRRGEGLAVELGEGVVDRHARGPPRRPCGCLERRTSGVVAQLRECGAGTPPGPARRGPGISTVEETWPIFIAAPFISPSWRAIWTARSSARAVGGGRLLVRAHPVRALVAVHFTPWPPTSEPNRAVRARRLLGTLVVFSSSGMRAVARAPGTGRAGRVSRYGRSVGRYGVPRGRPAASRGSALDAVPGLLRAAD